MEKKRSLVGWTRFPLADGILLVPPHGGGRIRVYPSQAPRPLQALVDGLLRSPPPGFTATLTHPPAAMITLDGEHAAIFEVVARLGDAVVQRTIGSVFGDEHFIVIDGSSEDPAWFEETRRTVEALTLSSCLGLGLDRFRPFFYRPPAGWTGISRYQAEQWLAPDYPANDGSITVFRARPVDADPARTQHMRLFEDLTAEFKKTGGHALHTKMGLSGQVVLFDGPTRAANVGLSDGRYLYYVRLLTKQAHRELNTPALLQLVESIHPVPLPRTDLAALIHWSE